MVKYPSEVELNRIRNFFNWKELVEFVTSVWADYGICKLDPPSYCAEDEDSYLEDPHYRWTLVTGGWSGNEDIINALEENKHLFWQLNWTRSERGGRYEFEIPDSDFEAKN